MGKIQYCEGRSFEEVFKKFSPVISKLPGSCLSQSLRGIYWFGNLQQKLESKKATNSIQQAMAHTVWKNEEAENYFLSTSQGE